MALHFTPLYCMIIIMSYVPRITPVRVKSEPISRELIDPGSMGHYFPPASGPRVVYLDNRYDYPEQKGDNPNAERVRQAAIWDQVDKDGATKFLDRHAEEVYGRWLAHVIRNQVQTELGTRYSAEFYERVFGTIFDEQINVVIISTGVNPSDGNNYHDIGYLRP